jgi:hypothetical protein
VKKLFFTTGIIIFLIGIVVAANYNISTAGITVDPVATVYGKWEVSGTFKAGERIHVRIGPASNWSEGVWDIDDVITVFHKHIWVEIVDPSGDVTEYNTAWTIYDPSGGIVPFSLCYINMTIQGRGINNAQYPKYIGGIALLNGTYTVRVIKEFEPPLAQETPPYYISLLKEYPFTDRPYTYLLPVGIFISCAGAVISVLSSKPRRKKASANKLNLL